MNNKHVLHKCDESGCFTCEGGLSYCYVCMSSEGEMPTDCPEVRISQDKLELIYNEKLDFKDGQWIMK